MIRFFLFYILIYFLSISSLSAGLRDCKNSLKKLTIERNIYRTSFSSDLSYLDRAQFNKGHYPQWNMTFSSKDREMFELDEDFLDQISLRKSLLAKNKDKVLMTTKSKQFKSASQELLDYLFEILPREYPEYYSRNKDILTCLKTGESFKRVNRKIHPLNIIAQIVQEDVAILLPGRGGHLYIRGGVLAFPTNWSLPSKIGENMVQIHEGIGPPGMNLGEAIERRMMTLKTAYEEGNPTFVKRNNWFVMNDPTHAQPNYRDSLYYDGRITSKNVGDKLFLRSESQRIKYLPKSGAFVFTMKVYNFPLSEVANNSDAARRLYEGLELYEESARLRGELPDDNRMVKNYLSKYFKKSQLNREIKESTPTDTKILQSAKISSSTHLLRLSKPKYFQLTPGDALRITIETENGSESRILSLASSPTSNYIEVSAGLSDSEFKKAFKKLKVGRKVQIEKVSNGLRFDETKPIVMIAGGIGITPCRSFLNYVNSQKIKTPIYLYYSNRSDIAFKNELDQIQKKNPNIQIKYILSKPKSSWKGQTGRIDKDFLQTEIQNIPEDANYYIVGNSSMNQDTQSNLIKLGVSPDRVHTEPFESHTVSNVPVEKMKKADKVCFCYNVTLGQINEAIQVGAKNIDDVKNMTGASTGCGNCKCKVNEVLKCNLKP